MAQATQDTVQQDDGSPPEEIVYAIDILFSADSASCGRIERLPRETIQLGRKVTSGQHLTIADPLISKRHAELTWSPVRQCYLLGDLRSSNGTYLNGVKIERELITPGDIVRIGDTVFRLSVFQPDAVGWSAPADSLLIGRSLELRRVLERLTQAAESEITVLLEGETGTGKELLAQTLHQRSGRPGPLRALNCAAIPADLVESELFGHVKGAFSGADTAQPGLFRAADGGTLFLDEVGELAEATQPKLLRAIETRRIRPVGAAAEQPVDVRIVAATNRDLEAEVAGSRFRPDLFARLAEWQIEIAPLRDRPEDLWPLWRHFLTLRDYQVELEMKGPVFEALALHRWPYNVRELSRLVHNLLLAKPRGGKLDVADLPASLQPVPNGGETTSSLPPPGEVPTAQELRRLVEEYDGNIKEVAAFLGKDRTQVYRWLKRHNIDPAAYRN